MEWRYSPIFVDFVTRWRWVVSFTPLSLYPGKRAPPPSTHTIGGWVGPRVGLDAVEKSKILHCQESVKLEVSSVQKACWPCWHILTLSIIRIDENTIIPEVGRHSTARWSAEPCIFEHTNTRCGRNSEKPQQVKGSTVYLWLFHNVYVYRPLTEKRPRSNKRAVEP
jgi:hypothetical protein